MTTDAFPETLDTLRSLGIGLAVALALKVIVFQPYTIPSSSMEPGLQTGDYIVASKFDYGWSGALPFGGRLFEGRVFGRSARRGDVVVFRLPRDERQTYVKRVIGLPGDRVQVVGGRVLVNGAAIPARMAAPAVDHDAPNREVVAVQERMADGPAYLTFDAGQGHPGDDTGVYVVPAGSYFMMGDNRDNSIDSRWPTEAGVGFVPAQNVLGKARLVLASWKPGASLWKPWTWARLEGGRFFMRVT